MKMLPASILIFSLTRMVVAGLEPGDGVMITLRGVSAAEQEKINGRYRVGESGGIQLPFLDQMVPAKGNTPEQFARMAEKAYRDGGIYTKPTIIVEAVTGGAKDDPETIISVGGEVRRAGEAEFRKGMTVIQALDAVGGRSPFGGRNLLLLRDGRQYCLDFKKLAHKNIQLQPNDSLQVEQKAVIDRWKGDEKSMKDLLK